MSNSTALDVMRLALQQYRYTEWPPGTNRTKYGKWFGMNGVYWCAEYVSWCAFKAPGDSPIVKSANAATIQDLTVQTKNGKYVLPHTGNNKKKLAALDNIKFGDSISFNFNGGTDRDHTGLVVSVWGDHIYCIEGNTSLTEKGSQSNGGAVAYRNRFYTTNVCTVRPAYKPAKFPKPDKAFSGSVPKLPKRGWFQYGDKGEQVGKLQKALAWANCYSLKADNDFGSNTFAEVVIFQVAHGLEPDGQFGDKCLRKLNQLIKNLAGGQTVAEKKPEKKPETKKKTNKQKLNDLAIKDAYSYGTKKSRYAYPGGKPKEHYKKDLDKAFPDRSGWWKQTRAGAACDVYVPTVIRASGVDKHIPHGLEYMIPYLEEQEKKKNGKFKRVVAKHNKKGRYYSPAMLKGGDIVVLMYKGGGAHTFFVVEKNGKKYIAEAQFHGKTYPHISKVYKTMYKEDYKMLRVYRAKG